MKLKVQINGFRCNEETDGLGSDEIGFFIAGLPCDKDSWGGPSRWTYNDLERHWRVRWAGGIDSGDHHDFQYPISFLQELDPAKGLEIIFYLMEIDGPSSTESQAREEHDGLRAAIEGALLPGNLTGTFRPWSGQAYAGLPSALDSGAGFANDSPEDLLARNVWHVDLARPLEGSIPAERAYVTGGPGLYAPGSPDVYRNPTGDQMVETRSYKSEAEGSRYTFDVHYSIVP